MVTPKLRSAQPPQLYREVLIFFGAPTRFCADCVISLGDIMSLLLSSPPNSL